MEQVFTYVGPRDATDVRLCLGCASASAKRCQTTPAPHGKKFSGCGLCDAAASGVCLAHCGLAAALSAHKVAESVKELFADWSKFAQKVAESFSSGCTVRAHFSYDAGNMDDNPRNFRCEVVELKK